MLHIDTGADVTLSGGNFCGGEFVVVKNDGIPISNVTLLQMRIILGFFPVNKSDGITATYQQKTQENLPSQKMRLAFRGWRLRSLFLIENRIKLRKHVVTVQIL